MHAILEVSSAVGLQDRLTAALGVHIDCVRLRPAGSGHGAQRRLADALAMNSSSAGVLAHVDILAPRGLDVADIVLRLRALPGVRVVELAVLPEVPARATTASATTSSPAERLPQDAGGAPAAAASAAPIVVGVLSAVIFLACTGSAALLRRRWVMTRRRAYDAKGADGEFSSAVVKPAAPILAEGARCSVEEVPRDLEKFSPRSTAPASQTDECWRLVVDDARFAPARAPRSWSPSCPGLPRRALARETGSIDVRRPYCMSLEVRDDWPRQEELTVCECTPRTGCTGSPAGSAFLMYACCSSDEARQADHHTLKVLPRTPGQRIMTSPAVRPEPRGFVL